jgi:YVTN family beta-propeller protein
MRHAFVILPVLALLSCRSTAPAKPASSEQAAATPPAPASYLVFVSNEASGDIGLIDGLKDELVAKVPIGKRPRGLKLSRDGRYLLVAVSGSARGGPGVDESKLPPPDRAADGIALVDVGARQLIGTVESGPDPESFDLSADGKLLFVSNEDAGTLSVVDFATRKIIKVIPVGVEPEGVTTSPDGAFVYVTCEEDNAVAVVSVATLEVIAKIPTGGRPRQVVFSADGSKAWVSGENTAQVTEVDARKHAVLAQIAIPGELARPMGLALSADGRTLYVSNGRGKSVGIIDVETRSTQLAPDVGQRPWGLALSPDGARLYTANGPSNDVSVIDVRSGSVLKRIATGGLPWGIVVAPSAR